MTDRMSREEQNTFLSRLYAEALRYMDNAKGTLGKAGQEGSRYTDKKYVRTACGTAYNGVLVALDAWFVIKGIPEPSKKQRKSIKYYMSNITQKDRKLASDLEEAYEILHLCGYYDGITNAKLIAAGFEVAYDIIERIRPERPEEAAENGADKAKRLWNNLLTFVAATFS